MKAVWSIIFKDVIVELRNKETLSAMIMFAILILVIFSFAFESSGVEKSAIAPGCLWVAFSFAAILGLNRSLATPYGTTEIRPAMAPRRTARARRSSLQAVTHAARLNAARAASPASR